MRLTFTNISLHFLLLPTHTTITTTYTSTYQSNHPNQFFITSRATSHLDGKHVVFGRVVQGLEEVFRVIESTPKSSNDRPIQPVVIADCGMYDDANPPAPYQQ